MESKTNRVANILLLRDVVFRTTQKEFGKLLGRSQTEISQYEMRDKPLSDYFARDIEKKLKLPTGWMDRDNANLFLDEQEFDLVKSFRRQPDMVRQRLLELISALSTKPAK